MKIILLIDDDIEDHDTIKQAFYDADSTVHCLCYRNCADAILHLTTHKIPHLYCILIDMHMPRMMGLECLRAVTNLPSAQGVDIFMISSEFREYDLEELCRYGAKALCIKPSSWTGYQAMAEIILGGNITFGSIISG